MATATDEKPYLTEATQEEILEILKVNSQEWKGSLSLEAYIRREEALNAVDLAKSGGLTSWVLVTPTSPRRILASCESIRKRAFLSNGGKIREVTSHGVASVFCAPEDRGRGYAGEMIRQLTIKLQTWQEKATGDVPFAVLYSDIGKKFYAKHGWVPFPSAHVSLVPWVGSASSRSGLPVVQPLRWDDLPGVCEMDEHFTKTRLEKVTGTAVGMVPDWRTLEWQLTRERFVSNELYSKTPDVHGGVVQLSSGKIVWCYWTKMWYNPDPKDPKDNTLHVLRLGTNDMDYDAADTATEEGAEKAKNREITAAIASLLAAAQAEASYWNMGDVEVWNPSSTTLAAARLLDPSAEVTHRDKDSVASLKWYGDAHGTSADQVEWLDNEKYAWC